MTQLAAQHLKAAVIERDGVRLLYVQDGETAVEVTAEMGSLLAAADGLQRLADYAGDLADALRSAHRVRQRQAEIARPVVDEDDWWRR